MFNTMLNQQHFYKLFDMSMLIMKNLSEITYFNLGIVFGLRLQTWSFNKHHKKSQAGDVRSGDHDGHSIAPHHSTHLLSNLIKKRKVTL